MATRGKLGGDDDEHGTTTDVETDAAAEAMDDFAVDPGDRVRRRSAADGAGELETWLAETEGTVRARSARVAAYASVALVVSDTVSFAGVEPGPTVDSGPHPTQPHE